MYSVALINPPFASLRLPSLALTQLKAVVDAAFAGEVQTEVLYLNHDFGESMGAELYQRIAVDMEAPYNGFGDWLFRLAAFPDLADNVDIYFQRFFPHRTEQNLALKRRVLEMRPLLDATLDTLIDKYDLASKDLVGFTSMFSQNMACFALAQKIKARNAAVEILFGGANCETPMGEEIVKNVDPIDFVFSGGALKSFPAFLRATLDRQLDTRDRLPGVFSRAGLARPLSNAGTIGAELPLDEHVPLDYDSFIASLDAHFHGRAIAPILLFETSRGCWWGQRAHCTFCGLNGQSMNYRAMSPDNAVNQIRSLFKYSSRVARLQCVDNIMPKTYPKEVFARLDTPSNMKIFYEVKADLTEEDLQLLSAARVREVQPGIEALATSTLKLMKKGTTVFQNLRFLANCTNVEIFPCWSLLVGFPGEGADVYSKYVADIPQLVHLPPPCGVYPVRPDRYSPYHVKAAEYGFDLRPCDFYELVYPFSREALTNLAYFFRDFNFGAEYFTAMVEWLGKMREKVDAWRRRWDPQAHAMPPMLYLDARGDTAVVHDSRGSSAVEHEISAEAVALLQCLNRPRARQDLAAALAGGPAMDVATELAALEALGLVFHEGDRVMSLVFPTKPSWKEAIDGWSWAA